MSDSPLFPWIAEEGVSPLNEEIKEPISGASITLPRLNGLSVNEVLFSQWALEKYAFTRKSIISTGSGDEMFLATDPATLIELAEFCHYFLCLRLGLADWVGEDLSFVGDRITPAQSLSMPTTDGQRRAAPLYLLYMIYSFWIDEQNRWTSGKADPQVMTILGRLLAMKDQPTGENSTTITSENTPADSPAEPLPDALPTQSKARSRMPLKTASVA